MRHEYIVQVDDADRSYDFAFVRQIRGTCKQLVRCRDCKAYLPETETLASHCPVLGIYGLPEDAYCYKAQRKDNDQS